MSFKIVNEFEEMIADFFNAPFAVAVDSCTHAIELSLRLSKPNLIQLPKHTYVGIAMLASKLAIDLEFVNNPWQNFYHIGHTRVIDAAVLWKKHSYMTNSFMCLSFQYQKHINIGRGGMILTDCEESYKKLIKMSYDGRDRNIPWRDQDISTTGYHYYMTPEYAKTGIEIFKEKKNLEPKKVELFGLS
jgi:dTDP-4-amino-4,6-dideoxygalactose transaminase